MLVTDIIAESLKTFLNFYWLRPETAIWRTIDSVRLNNIKLESPSLDIGCGDGSFTFGRFLGQTSTAFDMYRTMDETSGFFAGKDIHDQTNNIKPTILKKPRETFDIGIDWKENLLKKAEFLHAHKKLAQHDANKNLPFESESFKYIFSNIFYWIEDIESLLKESNRILQKNGKMILFLPDKKFQDNLIYKQYEKHGYDWAKVLDRGIHENIKHCYSLSKWKNIFTKTNFNVKQHTMQLSKSFVEYWNIGLRPYSPFFIEMANKLETKDRVKIKQKFVKELFPILYSYVKSELKKKESECCFHMFVLSKNK